jgi:hypothetical protein
LVEIAGNAEAIIASIERMLGLSLDTTQVARRIATVDAHLAGNSWDRTWAEMRRLIAAAASLAATDETFSQPMEVALV